MSVIHTKSTAITNADATPPVANTAGEGAPGALQNVSAAVTTAAADADSTFRFVRVPTTAKVKRVWLNAEAQSAGTFDIGVYYPTIGKTGMPDLAANAVDQDFFASSVVCSSAVRADETNESGTYTGDKWNQPLWQAVGLSSDPGGFFDIVLTVKTTAVTTGGLVGLSVDFTQ